MKNVQYFSLVTMALIFASLACGFVEVGVETPTTGDEFNNAVDTQEPTSDEVKTTEEIIQPTDETDDEKDDSTLTVAYLAYVGPDNNLWVLEADSQTPRQITFDANRTEGDGAKVEYLGPILSSDGTLLAYYMDVGTPSANGYEYTHGLWVANLITGEQRKIMDGRFAGLAWKPGTHLLAYGHEVDTDYSNPRGEWDTDQAMGIHAIDLSESVSMETGMFAYYDLENQEYVAWDESVGRASWSPDGSLLTYDRIYYVATGEGRLYLRPRQGDEKLLGPDYEGPAFASQPVFSPAGDQIAYLARLEGPETDFATIMVLDIAGGEPKSLGQFEDVWELAWIPDGSHLVFSFGLYPSRHIIALNISDGSQTVLAAGTQPALAGQ
jgi:Tol biopolymer transport system component